MRIEYYEAESQSLYIHEPDVAAWVDSPLIRRREQVQSLRNLSEDPHDPALDSIEGIVLSSSTDGRWPDTPAVIEGGFLRFTLGSCDRWLDYYTADFQRGGRRLDTEFNPRDG